MNKSRKEALELTQLELDIRHRIREETVWLYTRVIIPTMALTAAVVVAYYKL